jgi:mannose-6-phosphate isomerase
MHAQKSNTLNQLAKAAKNLWIPRWFELFSSSNQGFHERLGKDGNPIELPRRLLSQCRQIYIYSLALSDNPELSDFKQKLDETFAFVQDVYFIPETGGSIFSINSKNKPEDTKYDLYAHAFVLLACSAYYETTKNEEALKYAKTTLNFIKDKFRLDIGFAEALDSNLKPLPAIRRQNPHMHLLEACLFMFKTSEDQDYLNIARELIDLFFAKFFDPKTGTLGEFFDDDLNSHSTEGNKIEAGHHGEWVWLLDLYKETSKTEDLRIDKAIDQLFKWISKHSIDKEFGAVYNVQDRQGHVLSDDKRIWTLLETMRCCTIITKNHEHKDKAQEILLDLTTILKTHYMDMETGNWSEVLNRQLQPITNHMPATTPYHIYPILREIKD